MFNRFVLSLALALGLLPSPSVLAREKVSATEYTHAACQKILKDNLEFQSFTVRGAAIDKIKSAMQEQLPHLKSEGIVFNHEELVTGPDGTAVNFSRASFTSIESFFDRARETKAIAPNLLNAIESAFMKRIGAIVYEPAAQSLYEIYIKYRQAKNISGPFPFEVQLTAPSFLDFRETSAAALERFLNIIDSADDYAKTRPVQDWLLKAHDVLIEAKMRDLPMPVGNEQIQIPEEVLNAVDPFLLAKPLTPAQAARIATIRAARAKLRTNIAANSSAP